MTSASKSPAATWPTVVSTGTGPCPFLPRTGWSSRPATVTATPSSASRYSGYSNSMSSESSAASMRTRRWVSSMRPTLLAGLLSRLDQGQQHEAREPEAGRQDGIRFLPAGHGRQVRQPGNAEPGGRKLLDVLLERAMVKVGLDPGLPEGPVRVRRARGEVVRDVLADHRTVWVVQRHDHPPARPEHGADGGYETPVVSHVVEDQVAGDGVEPGRQVGLRARQVGHPVVDLLGPLQPARRRDQPRRDVDPGDQRSPGSEKPGQVPVAAACVEHALALYIAEELEQPRQDAHRVAVHPGPVTPFRQDPVLGRVVVVVATMLSRIRRHPRPPIQIPSRSP